MLTQHLGERLRDEIWRNPDRHQTRSLGEIYLQFPFPQVEAQTHRSTRSSCGSSRGADLPPCPAVHLSVCLSATLIRGLLAPPLSSSFFGDNFICLFLAALCLCCFAWAFSSCGEQGLLFSCGTRASRCGGSFCTRLLGAQASVVVATQTQQLRCTGLVALRHEGSARTGDPTHVPCSGRRILYPWPTREVLPSSFSSQPCPLARGQVQGPPGAACAQ